MKNEAAEKIYLVESVEQNHLQSLKSLCELLMREVSVLTTIDAGKAAIGNNYQPINLSKEVERFEANLIRSALVQSGGRQNKAARMLGVKLTTLNAKIKRYRIDIFENA